MKKIHGGDIYSYDDLIDFSVNVNPFGPSEHVLSAVRESLMDIGKYPDVECRKLRHVLAEHQNIAESWITFGNGAADLIFSLCQAIRPKKAVLTIPSFAEYERALLANDCEISPYLLKKENEFQLDEAYLDCLTEEMDLVFLCSPDNPSGKLIPKQLLHRIVQKCEENHIYLILDECFCEFAEEESEMLGMLEQSKHLILLHAFTKMHAMPGIRLGYLLSANEKIHQRLEEIRQCWSVSIPAQAAGIAALADGRRVEETRVYVQQERIWMESELKQIGVAYISSDACYILLKSSWNLFDRLLEKGFLIRDCSNYQGLAKGYYRIAVKLHEENEKLMQALFDIYRSEENAVSRQK